MKKEKAMKKGFISSMVLGLFLLAAIITFGGTVADEIVVHNKINNLKNVTDNAALAAGKHFVFHQDTADAETMARNMLDKTELGSEVRDTIAFEWDLVSEPQTVKAIITNYSQTTFWYKFLQKDSFLIERIESLADIINGDINVNPTSSLSPLGVNICNRPADDFVYDNPFTFTFTTSPYYDDQDHDGIFAIDKACDFPTGNSNFAHWKSLFNNAEIDVSDYDLDNPENGCFVDTSFQNPLSVDPKQFYDSLKHFDMPFELDLLVLDCGTNYSDDNITNPGELVVSNILTLRVDALPALTKTKIDGNNANIMTIETRIGGFENVVLRY